MSCWDTSFSQRHVGLPATPVFVGKSRLREPCSRGLSFRFCLGGETFATHPTNDVPSRMRTQVSTETKNTNSVIRCHNCQTPKPTKHKRGTKTFLGSPSSRRYYALISSLSTPSTTTPLLPLQPHQNLQSSTCGGPRLNSPCVVSILLSTRAPQ